MLQPDTPSDLTLPLTTQQEAFVFRALRRLANAAAPAELEQYSHYDKRRAAYVIDLSKMPEFLTGLEEARKRDRLNTQAARKAFLKYKWERRGPVTPLPLP